MGDNGGLCGALFPSAAFFLLLSRQECGNEQVISDLGRIVKRPGVDGSSADTKLLYRDLPVLVHEVEPDRVGRAGQHAYTPFIS